jgi:hypothetical protein
MAKSICILVFIYGFAYGGLAKDTLKVKDTDTSYVHYPKRSALFSLIPGGGQIYNEYGYHKYGKKNRAWWKVPLIYGALTATSYFWYQNYQRSQLLKEEILYRRDFGDSTNLHSVLATYTTEFQLTSGYTDDSAESRGFDDVAKRRDLLLFATIGVFGLQMLEAYVDGHFVSFDVSEDLSLSWYPRMLTPSAPGISLAFNFK